MRLCINMLIFAHNLGNWLKPRLHSMQRGKNHMDRRRTKAVVAARHSYLSTCLSCSYWLKTSQTIPAHRSSLLQRRLQMHGYFRSVAVAVAR